MREHGVVVVIIRGEGKGHEVVICIVVFTDLLRSAR
jgi:hypothetical protein